MDEREDAEDAWSRQSYSREALDLARAYQRAVIRQRTRAALNAKRARGERIGNLPYGWKLAADGLHLLADEAEQGIIETIRKLSRDGLSQRAIVVDLARRGVMGRKGTPLQQTQVARLLRCAPPARAPRDDRAANVA